MKHYLKEIVLTFFLILWVSLPFMSCSHSDNSEEGILRLSLTDASTTEYQACYVTIKEVKVLPKTADGACESDDCWIVVAAPEQTYNLLELVNGTLENLGGVILPAGTYEEMRIVLGDTQDHGLNIFGEAHPYANYVIDAYDNIYELTLPEDDEEGYNIAYEFTVDSNNITDLVLDFNVVKSIVQQGSAGAWMISPAISVLSVGMFSELTGLITDAETGAVLEGVSVSAQQTSEDDGTEIVVASTVSDETGGYMLMLDPGTYTIVANLAGYEVASSEVTIDPGMSSVLDFSLIPEQGEGTITGMVIIDGGEDDQFISISIRKTVTDETGDTIVEVAYLNVANGGQYTFDLPVGTYSLLSVFMVNGIQMTLETGDIFVITDGAVIEFDIIFSSDADEIVEGCSCDCDRDRDDGCGKHEKVRVCHRGREMHISKCQLKAHLRHGGSEMECSPGDESDNNHDDQDKVKICHKGRTMKISKTSLKMHLDRGDRQGECSCN